MHMENCHSISKLGYVKVGHFGHHLCCKASLVLFCSFLYQEKNIPGSQLYLGYEIILLCHR